MFQPLMCYLESNSEKSRSVREKETPGKGNNQMLIAATVKFQDFPQNFQTLLDVFHGFSLVVESVTPKDHRPVSLREQGEILL